MSRALLIVDDNKSVRDSLRMLLERRGYVALVAENGPEAVALATEHHIDGAMIDVNMPGMNGLALCRMLRTRASEVGCNLPVWMMTGARTNELEQASIESGALMLLAKPFNYAELFQRFEERLGPAPSAIPAEPVPPSSPTTG
jgi:CheY-like chemotaxis protein